MVYNCGVYLLLLSEGGVDRAARTFAQRFVPRSSMQLPALRPVMNVLDPMGSRIVQLLQHIGNSHTRGESDAVERVKAQWG